MTGRGHEHIASDRGEGPIFGIEFDCDVDGGQWWATVRPMGLDRRLLARRRCGSLHEADAALRALRRILATTTSGGCVEQTLREWEADGDGHD